MDTENECDSRHLKKTYKKIPLVVSIHLRYLRQDKNENLEQLMQRYPQFSKSSISRHSKQPIGEIIEDRRHYNKGRPSKVTERDCRMVSKSVKKLREEVGKFSVEDIKHDTGLPYSIKTFRRLLQKLGYRYVQCRKKGLLLKEDLKARVKFARKCKRLPANFWQDGVGFYLDGTSWVHKTDPKSMARTSRTRVWRRKGECLDRNCTSKGKKEGSGGKVAKFMVAIAFGKGVVKCHQYTDHVSGEMFSQFIKDHFVEMFELSANPKGKLFLQDGDPSQNSKLAKEAMDSIPCRLFHIPARSPDLNPIENIFHLIGNKLKRDALDKNITKETFQSFSTRVKRTVLSFPSDVIDKTIASMPKRINMVIKNGGHRTKY